MGDGAAGRPESWAASDDAGGQLGTGKGATHIQDGEKGYEINKDSHIYEQTCNTLLLSSLFLFCLCSNSFLRRIYNKGKARLELRTGRGALPAGPWVMLLVVWLQGCVPEVVPHLSLPPALPRPSLLCLVFSGGASCSWRGRRA